MPKEITQETARELLDCLMHELRSYSPKVEAILAPHEIAWKHRQIKAIAKAKKELNA